jgi:hypothetical protein
MHLRIRAKGRATAAALEAPLVEPPDSSSDVGVVHVE